MKLQSFTLYLFIIVFLASCGGAGTEEELKVNFLDSTFQDNPRKYRRTLDSIRVYKSLNEKEVKQLRDFIGEYRKSVPKGWTYGQIWEARGNINSMLEDAVELEIENLWSRTVKKVVEFRYLLKFKNNLDIGVKRIRGQVLMHDDDGLLINRSPTFVVDAELQPGDTIGGLKLEFAYYKPTGNEMNDPDLDAFRDTLKWMKSVAARDTATHFKFRLRDVILENGMTVEDYWLTDKNVRDTMNIPRPKQLGLLKWVAANEALLKNVKKDMSGYYLEVTPVLTEHVEDSHGQWLIFDRRMRVVKFFTTQKKIAGRKINPPSEFGKLLKADMIDYWSWPMEVRIYRER